MPEQTDDPVDASLAALDHVDAETVETLRAADVDAAAIEERRVSVERLRAAGVDEETAAALRRTYSLQWSFAAGIDLVDRAESMRDLSPSERAWIAASSGDWESADIPSPERRPSPSISYRKPTPVTSILGVDEDDAAVLATGGVVSVKTLAHADPQQVARALDLPLNQVTSWHWRAREERGTLGF